MIELLNSRRLTGPNLHQVRPGAVLDVRGPEAEVEAIASAWREHARHMLDAVGWTSESMGVRSFSGGASLVLSAPVDTLYAATEANEWAFEAARAEVAGETIPALDEAAARLEAEIVLESNPKLLRLKAAAEKRGVLFLSDDERGSVGTGAGCLVFDVARVPDPETVDWSRVFDVPLVLVTGTNGKSTTVRAVASMIRSAEKVPGLSSTDWVLVGDEILDRGDYAGPEGARRVLRDPRVEAAVLEVARGGMLRRGLAVRRADGAAVLNVAPDHLGEFGVHTIEDLVATKMIVRHAVSERGRLILGLDDPALADWQRRDAVPVTGFSRDSERGRRIADGSYGEGGAWIEEGCFIVQRGGRHDVIATTAEVPMTLGGAAGYNIDNALAALLLGDALGLPGTALRKGLLAFVSDPSTNPGRTNLFTFGGVRVLADFAHNPQGVTALLETASHLAPKRTLVTLGQAGDRDDEAIAEMCRAAWAARPDRILIKEMESLLRGRAAGDVADRIEAELRRAGAGDEAIERVESEMSAVHEALRWARDGDLLLLLLHAERGAALDLLQRMSASSWKPGQPLP